MRFTRRILLAAAALSLAIVFGGCAQSGKLIVGVDVNQSPLSFVDQNGSIAGFEVDMATEAAKRAGLTVSFVPVDWSHAPEVLAGGEVNSLWGDLPQDGLAVRDMLVSRPVISNEQVFMVPKESQIKDKNGLAGKAVGVLQGSSAEQALLTDPISQQLDGAAPQSFSDSTTMFEALESYQLDALCLNDTMAEYYIMQHATEYTLLEQALSSELYVVGFRRNDSMLCNRIQKVLDGMYSDGTAGKFSEKWFDKQLIVGQ